ncbi:hypothetical protein [Leifsonia sp. 71-9]|uniref:hypothetical protein n=1 Tax=Leifsonia sp. 71-9 TaxID=1895934 RepID=UPI00092C3409|nr:hypothetical protein [Leifsonia sp. 71-9]OJX72812.1 MAG: hypothetical protein BGO91_13660 [Leifsonia sp. 71-9]
MNRQWTFTLGYERAPKGLNANDRPSHWAVKHASTQNVRLFVSTEIRALNIPTLQKCRVDVVWVVNTRHRRDEDNLAPFLKAIYDGIGADKGISAHLVPDDAPQYMEKVGATIRYEKDAQPHFEVTITEVTG